MMEKCLLIVLLMSFSIGLASMLGGWETVPNPNKSSEIQRISRFATGEINDRINELYAMTCTTIVSASKQIVSGVNYSLTIELSPTCKNTQSYTDVENSALLEGPLAESMDLTCTVEVYEIAWENIIKLKDFNCNPTHVDT